MYQSRRARRVTGARSAIAVVAFALFGLLAMHGWGSHLGMHSTPMAPSHATMVQVSTDSELHQHRDAPASVGTASVIRVDPDDHGGGEPLGHGLGLLGLCLAVLGAFGFAVWLLLWRRELGIPSLLRPTWCVPAFTGRDRDPPGLRRLCVIRC